MAIGVDIPFRSHRGDMDLFSPRMRVQYALRQLFSWSILEFVRLTPRAAC